MYCAVLWVLCASASMVPYCRFPKHFPPVRTEVIIKHFLRSFYESTYDPDPQMPDLSLVISGTGMSVSALQARNTMTQDEHIKLRIHSHCTLLCVICKRVASMRA